MSEPIICLGEYLVDRLFQRGNPASSEPGRALKNWVDYPGGAPANVAAALAKLGTPSRFVGCLGQDAIADWLIKALEQQGVRCQIQRHDDWPTRTVLVQRDESGDRKFIGFSAPDPGGFADAHLSPVWVEQVDFAGASYLVMGTLGLAYPTTATAMHRAQQRAQEQGLQLVIDLNWRPVFWPDAAAAPDQIRPLIAQAQLIKLSREEALWLMGTDSAMEICQRLPACEAVLLTDGAAGSTWATDSKTLSVPAFLVESEDTTGAGDSFLAGVLHQLHRQGWDCLQSSNTMESILRYASAVGALTTLRPGAIAALPTAREVDAFLYLQGKSPEPK
ncbi:carbohydrate kinase [filamentous cyanobacterium CCP5]|nr:carbohydrate kinase [filamentous cyanobacterium CCP5]